MCMGLDDGKYVSHVVSQKGGTLVSDYKIRERVSPGNNSSVNNK